jgi:hypothetical protein
MPMRPSPPRIALIALAASFWGATFACGTELRPVDASARIGGRDAASSELIVGEACQLLPGGTPMGRPDGVRSHVLPAGRYRALAADDAGVYFASPTGVLVTEPAPRGTRSRPGGIHLPSDPKLGASEYLGDANGITWRQRLPEDCRFAVEDAAEPQPK